ncbi:MAG TPA: efflux RND transporter periplasmic adaptor subunit [Steroidobacteraceae bacterium]|nr:efflux RND transporter periplasmic adaptor subunit [Steroidobacteraceae bacterium]
MECPSLRGAAVAALLSLAACGRAPQLATAPPPEVGVVRVHAESVPLTREVVGRLSPVRTADVRARVAGILLKRLYREGSEVREGQRLFQIDPAPLSAALDAALAALAQAEANSKNAHVTAERNRALLPSGLVARSDVDTSNANERSTAASVKQAEANVESARINLGYATVTAPISGRSGQQAVTEGALVGQGEATLLTTIQQIDHLYVNFDRPADEILRLKEQEQTGEVTLVEHDRARLQVLLPNGQPYHEIGTVDFADVTVDPTNGALAFRGVIANPDRLLLPGMFVNIRVLLGRRNHAFLVSQAAVRRDSAGAYVQVVGADGRVVQKRIDADTMSGSDWIITQGLADGDQVIVSGVDKVKPGMLARAVPYSAPAATTGSTLAGGEPVPGPQTVAGAQPLAGQQE